MKDFIAESERRFDERFPVPHPPKHAVWDFVRSELQRFANEMAENVEGMKKSTHKIVESKFWWDVDKWPNGEFEQYGEYMPFFKFAKKVRTAALSDVVTLLRGSVGEKPSN